MCYAAVITQIEQMRDYNSLSDQERYFDNTQIDIKVGVGILDISRDIPNHWVRKRCFDMTYWMINQSVKQNLCAYRGMNHSVSNILSKSELAGDTICIILAQGVMCQRLYKLISNAVKYYKNNLDYFVVGYLLAKEDRYPGLHRQLLIVNIKKWIELGRPEYREQGYFWDRKPKYINYCVSERKISAEYTPEWIRPASDYSEYSIVEDGANWVAIALEHGITIHNVDLETREMCVFLYPYKNTDKLEHVWKNLQDTESIDKLTNYTQRAWIRKLAYQELIEKNRVYAYNTERLSAEGIRSPGPIDSIFSAAAGFKTIAILRNNGFHENTIVNYYDWCDASLEFKKHLLETWDGIDFHKWLLQNDLKYNFSSTYRGNYEEFWQKELKNEFGNAAQFAQLWQRYKKLKHNYFVIDIVNECETLFEQIALQPGENKVLWTTNIWSTMMLHWNIEPEVIEQKYLHFESKIPSNLVLYGQDYLANDLQHRIRDGITETHPVFNTIWPIL